jgi:hypothetical protein
MLLELELELTLLELEMELIILELEMELMLLELLPSILIYQFSVYAVISEPGSPDQLYDCIGYRYLKSISPSPSRKGMLKVVNKLVRAASEYT